MSLSVPEALRGREALLDPGVLDSIINSCKNATRIRKSLKSAKLTYLGILLILPKNELLKVGNFGAACLGELEESLLRYGYRIGQAQGLFQNFMNLLNSHGYNALYDIYSANRESKKFIAFSAALEEKLAEFYGIKLPEIPPPEISPPATSPVPSGTQLPPPAAHNPNLPRAVYEEEPVITEIYLEMSLPEAIVTRIAEDPDTSRDLNKFCRDAFENAVRYFFDPDPLLPPPPPTAVSNNPSPENQCRPLRIPITLSHAWKDALTPSFLQNLATQLSSSAALRYQIMKEFGPATPK